MRVITLNTIAVGTAAALLVLVAFGYSLAKAEPLAPGLSTAQTTDFSAARKHHRRHVTVYRYGFRNTLEQNRSFEFKGAYPGEYAWRRSHGETVCDLGYGRWDSCSSN